MTAQQLREIRKSLKLSQAGFAAWLGKGVATERAVQFWESDGATSRKVPAYVRRIIELSNVPIEMPYDKAPSPNLDDDNPATIERGNTEFGHRTHVG